MGWEDVDFDAGRIRIARQLTKPGPEPTFGPPKNGFPRDITLSAETIDLLRQHKRAQAELKMKNRTTYCDLGLRFAKDTGISRIGGTRWGSRCSEQPGRTALRPAHHRS